MAKLPQAADYGLGNAPRPVRGIVDIQPDQTGKGVQGIGENVMRLAEKHIQEMDDIAVRNALTELSYKDTELALGDSGYLKLQQQDALKGDVLKRFPEQYQKSINDIAAKLQTKAAREAFTARAAEDMARFNRNMVGHIASQAEKAKDTSYLAAEQAGLAKVSALPYKANIDAVLQDTDARLSKDASQYDSETLNTIRAQKKAKVVATAVNALITNREFGNAEQVMKDYGGILQAGQPGAHTELKEKIATGKAITLSTDLGRVGITMFDEGKSMAEIGAYIESNAGDVDAARVISGAKSMVASHENDVDAAHTQTADKLYNAFLNNGSKLSPEATRKDARYLSLPEKWRNKLESTMDSDLKSDAEAARAGRESVARQRALEEDAIQRDPAVLDKVSYLLENPAELASLGNLGISQLKVGKAYGQMLTKARAEYMQNVKSFSVPKAMIDGVLAVVTDTELRKQMSVQSQMALQRWRLAHPTEIPDENRIKQIVANTTLLVHDVGILWNSKDYLLDAKQKGALSGKFMDVQRTKSKGGKTAVETVQVPAGFVADALEAHPELTKTQILELYDTYRKKGGK